nr:hypothetical protein [uncultured Lichenicoccus sp.]
MSAIDAEALILAPILVGGSIATATTSNQKAAQVMSHITYSATNACSFYSNGSLITLKAGQVMLFSATRAAALQALGVPLVAV